MKQVSEKPITTAQIKKIHVLLNAKGLMDEKRTLVSSISNGRTESSKELTLKEAGSLISFLSENNANSYQQHDNSAYLLKRLEELIIENENLKQDIKDLKKDTDETTTADRCSILNIIWEIAWKIGETNDDYQMNIAKLNMFCRQRGTVKKNIL